MKCTLLLLLLVSINSFASTKLDCEADSYRLKIEAQNTSDIAVTFKDETVLADGVIENNEVDLVARFKSVGEMTLFAIIGKKSPENYLFIEGKRIPVICR